MADPVKTLVKALPGPIVVTGAGGFVGVNLVKALLSVRDDVLALSRTPVANWRFVRAHIPKRVQKQLDVTDDFAVRRFVARVRPGAVFHLAAYGAYSKQAEWQQIYRTNFMSTVSWLEALKEFGGRMVTAGSSSEYGLHAAGPTEDGVLLPNSHYAVSKIGAYYAAVYYGKVFALPVVHSRLYAVYGPFEEPDRLIPQLVARARAGGYPPLVNPRISRDFIYITDVVEALLTLMVRMKPADYGEAFNIGTGVKTTMRELAACIRKVAGIRAKPVFGSMRARAWDVQDWYGNAGGIRTRFGWKARVALDAGLRQTISWQEGMNYDAWVSEATTT